MSIAQLFASMAIYAGLMVVTGLVYLFIEWRKEKRMGGGKGGKQE